jgi:hypothetical protein
VIDRRAFPAKGAEEKRFGKNFRLFFSLHGRSINKPGFRLPHSSLH